MNRADLLLHVLQDGEPHSRQDIQRRVGFFLTNNAASELRARGHDVLHTVEGAVHYYQLVLLRAAKVPLTEPEGSLVARSEGGTSAERVGRTSSSSGGACGNDGPSLLQLSLEDAA